MKTVKLNCINKFNSDYDGLFAIGFNKAQYDCCLACLCFVHWIANIISSLRVLLNYCYFTVSLPRSLSFSKRLLNAMDFNLFFTWFAKGQIADLEMYLRHLHFNEEIAKNKKERAQLKPHPNGHLFCESQFLRETSLSLLLIFMFYSNFGYKLSHLLSRHNHVQREQTYIYAQYSAIAIELTSADLKNVLCLICLHNSVIWCSVSSSFCFYLSSYSSFLLLPLTLVDTQKRGFKPNLVQI